MTFLFLCFSHLHGFNSQGIHLNVLTNLSMTSLMSLICLVEADDKLEAMTTSDAISPHHSLAKKTCLTLLAAGLLQDLIQV